MKVENSDMKKEHSVSYFALFDGHNGEEVAEALNENLHNYIIGDNFFNNPVSSILDGFKNIENALSKSNGIFTKCGSSAIISLLSGKINIIKVTYSVLRTSATQKQLYQKISENIYITYHINISLTCMLKRNALFQVEVQ